MGTQSSSVTEFFKLVYRFGKMLSRASIRWPLFVLVSGFLLIMGYSVYGHFEKFKEIRAEQELMSKEPGYKVFFLYSLEEKDIESFTSELEAKAKECGGELITDALIFNKNLFVDIQPSSPRKGLQTLYKMFGMDDFVNGYIAPGASKNMANVRAAYIDYNFNERNLDPDRPERISKDRRAKFLRDIRDFSENIPSSVRHKAFEEKVHSILRCLRRSQDSSGMKWYLSRVERIVPKQILNILIHLRPLEKNVIRRAVECDPSLGIIRTRKGFLKMSEQDRTIESDALKILVPRFSPIFVDKFIDIENRYPYVFLTYKKKLVEYLEKWKSEGHGLLSYEKLHYILLTVERLNNEMKNTQQFFLLIDFLIGIVFPSMVSLFISIYLKREIAFILFRRNRIKSILGIFFLIPLSMLFFVKFFIYIRCFGLHFIANLAGPLLISFFIYSICFWFLNRLCFKDFVDKGKLNLREQFTVG